jgi:uncharacterized protein (TIGR03435 family)
MAEIAEAMTGPMSAIRAPLNIVDRTGLEGTFDFELRLGPLPLALFANRSALAGAAFAPFGIRTADQALAEQLGLTLEESTAPFDVLVVDRINKPGA